MINEELVTVNLSRCKDSTMNDSITTYQRKAGTFVFMKNIKGKFPKLLTRAFITSLIIVSKPTFKFIFLSCFQ